MARLTQQPGASYKSSRAYLQSRNDALLGQLSEFGRSNLRIETYEADWQAGAKLGGTGKCDCRDGARARRQADVSTGPVQCGSLGTQRPPIAGTRLAYPFPLPELCGT